MNRIEEIKKRISVLPDRMITFDAKVPLKIPDPQNPRRTLVDPHGRLQQTRLDVVDAEDPFKKPIIHFHKYPDHGAYEKNWQEYADAFIHMKSDIQFLIDQLEGK